MLKDLPLSEHTLLGPLWASSWIWAALSAPLVASAKAGLLLLESPPARLSVARSHRSSGWTFRFGTAVRSQLSHSLCQQLMSDCCRTICRSTVLCWHSSLASLLSTCTLSKSSTCTKKSLSWMADCRSAAQPCCQPCASNHPCLLHRSAVVMFFAFYLLYRYCPCIIAMPIHGVLGFWGFGVSSRWISFS